MENTSAARSFAMENKTWTWEENKMFEIGLVVFPDGTPDRWGMIAASLGTKSVAEVEHHYTLLLEDTSTIEAGLVEPPPYPDMEKGIGLLSFEEPPMKKQSIVQRKTGKPWTEEEHKQFLLGLDKYGKGDWKSISRYVVQTRNPTQVASHAQKHFEHQERKGHNKKRRSIFDSSIGEGSSDPKPDNNYWGYQGIPHWMRAKDLGRL